MAEYNPSKIIKDGNTYNFRDTTKIPLAGSNQISGDLIPSTDGTVNLGTSTNKWANVYATTFNGNVTGKGALTLQSNSGTSRILIRDNTTSSFPSSINLYSKIGDGPEYGVFLNGSSFYPTINGEMSLGTSAKKWKTFNGINPGALSLPGDAYIDIDTTNYAWGSDFTFTPDYDGYCFLNIGSSSYSRIISLKTGRGEYYFSNQTDVFRFTFPVYKGKLVTIWTNSSGTESVIPTIRLFPCQGNV